MARRSASRRVSHNAHRPARTPGETHSAIGLSPCVPPPVTWPGTTRSVVNRVKSWRDLTRLYSAWLILALAIAVILASFFARMFALKAPDRAIRAEENLCHFVLTGTRFAPDEEFVALARRAGEENLSDIDIQKAVKNWKAGTFRV